MIQRSIHPDGPVVYVENGYQFWLEATPLRAPWRWAKISWPDDGLGVAGHGGAMTLDDARAAAQENKRIRDSVK